MEEHLAHRISRQQFLKIVAGGAIGAALPRMACASRDTGNIALASSVKTAVDPLAYLVGPVRVAYDSDPAKTEVVDLAKYIDRGNKTVRSITGQIETDYGRAAGTAVRQHLHSGCATSPCPREPPNISAGEFVDET